MNNPRTMTLNATDISLEKLTERIVELSGLPINVADMVEDFVSDALDSDEVQAEDFDLFGGDLTVEVNHGEVKLLVYE